MHEPKITLRVNPTRAPNAFCSWPNLTTPMSFEPPSALIHQRAPTNMPSIQPSYVKTNVSAFEGVSSITVRLMDGTNIMTKPIHSLSN